MLILLEFLARLHISDKTMKKRADALCVSPFFGRYGMFTKNSLLIMTESDRIGVIYGMIEL